MTIALFLVMLYGCSNALQLKYSKPAAQPPSKGGVAVIVIDERKPDYGGKEKNIVGNARNTFGVPFPIKAAPGREPHIVTKELITDCLSAAGYEVVGDKSNNPKLYAALKTFWTDGYQHNRMEIQVSMALKESAESKPAWQHDLKANAGKTWGLGGYSQFDSGFSRMLDMARDDLLKEFQSPRFGKCVHQ
jgi:hypothetical protein